MDCPLLMTDQQIPDLGIHQLVVQIKDHAAWKAENGVNPFLLQTFDNGLRACDFAHRMFLNVVMDALCLGAESYAS
jgi:hypothetical protein